MDKRIGAQLYTIREFTQTYEDFDKSMKKIKDIGYKQVQASGLGVSDGRRIKEICDKYGLEITCTHRPYQNYINDIEAEIEYHKALDCKIAGLGSMPGDEKDFCEEVVMGFINKMNGIYDRLAKEGIAFAYHNHSFEFFKINGKFIMDYFIEYGKFDFIVDVYWLAFSGINPADFIKKLGKRAICVHYKDMAMAARKEVKMAPIGDGNLDWDAITKACDKAGVKYALVEQDICEQDPFECLKVSYGYLTKKGFI